MADRKIILHKHNGTGYDNLYPKTTIEQVDGLQTALDSKQDDLTTSTDKGKYLHSNTSTGAPEWVTVDKSTVGLGNVDNTSDATKKATFTGAIASGNTGFPTGDAVNTAVTTLDTKIDRHIIFSASSPASLQVAGDFWIADTSPLPEDYTLYNYIGTSSWFDNVGINTGLTYGTGVRVVMNYEVRDVSGYGMPLPFLFMQSAYYDYKWGLDQYQSKLYFENASVYWGDGARIDVEVGNTYKLDVTIANNIRQFIVNDQEIYKSETAKGFADWSSWPVCFLGSTTDDGSVNWNGCMYWLHGATKFYDANNNLVRNFLPCKCNTTVTGYKGTEAVQVPANTAGVFDTVGQRFYVNTHSSSQPYHGEYTVG